MPSDVRCRVGGGGGGRYYVGSGGGMGSFYVGFGELGFGYAYSVGLMTDVAHISVSCAVLGEGLKNSDGCLLSHPAGVRRSLHGVFQWRKP